MRSFLLCIILAGLAGHVSSQTSTGSGDWTDGSVWSGGSAPPVTNISSNVTIQSGSKIISNTNISFNSGSSVTLMVNDTLIIYGNLSLGNKPDLIINGGGVLIIVGDYEAGNKTDVNQNGYLIVTGEFNDNSSSGTFNNNNSDGTYIFDDTPTVDPGFIYGDEDDIIDDPIFDFLDEILDNYCSLSLSATLTNISTAGGSDGAIDITITSGGGSYNFSWSTSDGSGLVPTNEDQTGLTAGTYSVAVSEGACFVFGSYTLTESACTDPTITGASPGSRCGAGTVNLSATASAGTINWYTASSGGTSIATGTSYTTPSISSTTSYWVDATDGGCTTVSRTQIVATVNSGPIPAITGGTTSCVGTVETYSVTNNPGNTYAWSIDAGGTSGVILTGAGTNSITVQWDPLTPVGTLSDTGIVNISESDGTCPGTDAYSVTVYKLPQTGSQYHISNTHSQ